MKTLKENAWVFAFVALLVAIGSFFVKNTVVEKAVQTFGGTSPEFSSPYLQINGVREWYVNVPTADLTSSTLCSIQSPAATSTLVHSSFRIAGGNTGSSITKVFKGATASATTTYLYGGATTGAGAQNTVYATSSTDSFVIAPSQYIVFDTSANYAQTGFCVAEFSEI